MHRAAVWQHSSNSSIKIFHNSIEHFFWNPSDFSSDDVISCLWIVFTNSFFQVLPQKMVRLVEVLGIGWPGVIDMTQNESVPWEVIPEVFKCSVREIRRHLISLWASEMGPFEKTFDSFFACYFLSQGVTCYVLSRFRNIIIIFLKVYTFKTISWVSIHSQGFKTIYQRVLRQLWAKSKTRAMIGRCKFIEWVVGRKFL